MESKIIFVVEDNKNIRGIISFILKKEGYTVYEAEDGEIALSEIKKIKPDLVVLDAMLPSLSGFDICADLKSSPEFKTIKILMLTAIAKDSGKSDEYWKEKSNADEFMSKPFKKNLLLTKINSLLEN